MNSRNGSCALLSAALLLGGCGSDVEVDGDALVDAIPEMVAGPTIDSGNPQVDAFLDAVVREDRLYLAEHFGGVESLSGREASFDDVDSYLERMQTCDFGETAESIPGTIEVRWNCAEGQFRQLIDTEFAAPKIIITELF